MVQVMLQSILVVETSVSIGNGLKIPSLMQKSKPTAANKKIKRFSDI